MPPVVAGVWMGGSFPAGEVPVDSGDPGLEFSASWVLDWVAANPAGPTAMTLLAGLPAGSLSPFEQVRVMAAWDRQVAHCEAMKLAAMSAVVDADVHQGEFVSHEVAAALRISRPAADRLVMLCRRLGRTLPGTARALADGLISRAHAMVLSEETGPLSAELAGRVEAALLPGAGSRTAGQLRYAAVKLIARLDPDGYAARHARRRPGHDVTVSDLGDGISGIWAQLDTPDAAVVKAAVDAWADSHTTQLPELTVGQRRTQALVEWAQAYLATDAPTRHGRPVSVDLVIDLPTLLGLAEHPGEIVGYGVIPADLARRLAADASWRRLVTDPQTGHLLDCGRTRYRPTQLLRNYLLAREKVSAFPGSASPSERCDIDHANPFPHGGTDRDNLGPLDRRAHRAKTTRRLDHRKARDGTSRWRSPTGHTYRTEPHDYRLGP